MSAEAAERMRLLLAAATPLPWRFEDPRDGAEIAIYGGPGDAIEDIAAMYPDEHGRSSAELIVRAVNEYEPHLALEVAARDWHDEHCGCSGEACELGGALAGIERERVNR